MIAPAAVSDTLVVMRKLLFWIALAGCSAFVFGAEWPTDGGNSKRTNFQPNETVLNTGNVKGLQVLWKVQLDNKPQEMHSLFPPLIVEGINTPD